MLYRTYITKFNTIVEDSDLNIGINPIAELNYGKRLTRMLFYFDCSKLKQMVCENITPDLSKFKHTLRIANCGSIDFTQLHCGKFSDIDNDLQIRASSFDLLFFLIPQEWDGGKGFDYKYTYFNQGYYSPNCLLPSDTRKLLSIDGANWFQAKNGYPWSENGIYSTDTLSKEYDKFAVNESNIIIARKHFDIGNENIDIDLTDVVNKFITGELENYGIGVAFSPMFENMKEEEVNNYVGFFTHKTNGFFEPFLESKYDDVILDDRSHFILDKWNRLYLYCNIGGDLTDLDVNPICTINDVDYEVHHQYKGVYYIDILLNSGEYKPNTMLYDTWSNIIYQGRELPSIELDFTLKTENNWFNIGNTITEPPRYSPHISGIKDKEQINRGDIRRLTIFSRVPYDMNKVRLVNNMELRLYVKDGESEIDVIPYDKVHKSFNENFYYIDTNMLIPNIYYIDIKYKYNGEVIVKKEAINFTIVNNLNNKYR